MDNLSVSKTSKNLFFCKNDGNCDCDGGDDEVVNMTMMMVVVTKEVRLILLEKTLTLMYNLRRRKFLSLERDILPGLSWR